MFLAVAAATAWFVIYPELDSGLAYTLCSLFGNKKLMLIL
jgi:hypothetical protein